MKPTIGITMGDPAGVGPEICAKLLQHHELTKKCRLAIYGDEQCLFSIARLLNLPFEFPVVTPDDWQPSQDSVVLIPITDLSSTEYKLGQVQKITGEASYQYIQHSIDDAMNGKLDAVCTAPINKEALHLAGYHYPGHTEIFIEAMQPKRSCMMLTSDEITCSLVTTHVGLSEVPGLLSVEGIFNAIELTAESIRKLRGSAPQLTVCGLNPHAGEGGLFGHQEEEKIIFPAVAKAREQGIQISDPLPPDTAFVKQQRDQTDAYICMYHDQGLIPLKALSFHAAVNTTLGLPVVRTSVDHGTAFDIAGQGIADEHSLIHAVKLAIQLCQ